MLAMSSPTGGGDPVYSFPWRRAEVHPDPRARQPDRPQPAEGPAGRERDRRHRPCRPACVPPTTRHPRSAAVRV